MKLRSETELTCFVRETGCTLRHLSLPPRILESMYIRYPIVLPRVIVAWNINADIRGGLANMSHRGAVSYTRVQRYVRLHGVKNTEHGTINQLGKRRFVKWDVSLMRRKQ